MADEKIKYDINEAEQPFQSADELSSPEQELPEENEVFVSRLAGLVEEKFEQAERGRQDDETRWLNSYHNYRGVYNKNVKFKENEKSKVFIKVTKTKTLAAYGQLADVVFSGSKFPLQIQETVVPDGIAKSAHLNPLKETMGDTMDVSPELEGNLDYQPQEGITEDNVGNFNPYDVGFAGDGNELKPGAIQTDTDKFLGSLEEEYTNEEGDVVVQEGPARSPEMPQIQPAQIAARRMEKLIHDQIEESSGTTELRNALFEAVLLGTGIIKGPFNHNKTLHTWEEIQINAWICMGKILRIVANPFKPNRIPYHAFPYEKNPYSFWGVGVPENMEDAQQIMNGHARMAIDNLALAGSLVFDIDEAALVSGQSMEIYPGKIFKRQAGMPGQSIYGLKFPNTAPENMQMFDRFRQLADESTGIPSYSHGNTGVQGMTRTASGMSMLMGAASLNIKTVVKNLDDFLLKPLGVAFYQWNMQFYEGDLNVIGDLEVKATGTSSLMQKEVRSQRLTTFLQSVQNPAVAPFVKVSKIIQELAYSLDFDPEEIINSPEEAAIYAEIIGRQNQPAAPEAGPADAMGGQIAPGAPAQPGEEGFSGGGGGANTPQIPPEMQMPQG